MTRDGTKRSTLKTSLTSPTPTVLVGAHDALCELGMERALHSLAVALVPPLDVVEGRLTNASGSAAVATCSAADALL